MKQVTIIVTDKMARAISRLLETGHTADYAAFTLAQLTRAEDKAGDDRWIKVSDGLGTEQQEAGKWRRLPRRTTCGRR